ncbi:hypothetical protein EHO60_14580 [Leptospira fletcheri]|uniref:Uncharacterized protein n=1 Tax=Leptospira fletcheri TaxID=2484981 RepID=A0A4R9GB79_9LEPT|nr:hypothetical protein [Leptospira fletcheri]TGK08615.1 hypothetical protein EHO60_14580 [Leptospira fletcheri]
MDPEEDPFMRIKTEFSDAFRTVFREFFGDEKDHQYELYELKSEESGPKGDWATFTVRNALGGRAVVFRFDPRSEEFYAMLKVQVFPGEEDWNLDSFFERNGFVKADFWDVKNSAGEWLFHSLARHYLGTIFVFCPRILEPDYILE